MKKILFGAAILAASFVPAQAQTDQDPGELALDVSLKCVNVFQEESPSSKSIADCREAGDLVETIVATGQMTNTQNNNAVIGGALMLLNQGIYEAKISDSRSCNSLSRSKTLLAKYVPGVSPSLDEFVGQQKDMHVQAQPLLCK